VTNARTKDEILEMAFALGKAIAETAEMEALREMQIRLNNDKEASGLVQAYQEARSQLENKRQDGLEILPGEVNHLQLLHQELNGNKLVAELIQIQESINNLMQGVYFSINQSMAGEECASDCESCGGSCSM
jgi:cell fate (sporulation/competence/biofilm development) regulator YlbF (YheA/YmcA/DUF963 family)